MKKDKQKPVRAARKAIRNDIKQALVARLKEVVATAGQNSKKLEKEIEKASGKLAKKLSKEIKADTLVDLGSGEKKTVVVTPEKSGAIDEPNGLALKSNKSSKVKKSHKAAKRVKEEA